MNVIIFIILANQNHVGRFRCCATLRLCRRGSAFCFASVFGLFGLVGDGVWVGVPRRAEWRDSCLLWLRWWLLWRVFLLLFGFCCGILCLSNRIGLSTYCVAFFDAWQNASGNFAESVRRRTVGVASIDRPGFHRGCWILERLFDVLQNRMSWVQVLLPLVVILRVDLQGKPCRCDNLQGFFVL